MIKSMNSVGHGGLNSSGAESKAEKAPQKVTILQLDKIKPADRVTFLMNYLYITIRNSQLLVSIGELTLLKDLFLACLESYVHIMTDWVTRGELNDPS